MNTPQTQIFGFVTLIVVITTPTAVWSAVPQIESGNLFATAVESVTRRKTEGSGDEAAAMHYFDLAREWVEAGESDRAIDAINAALELRPDLVHSSLYWLGRAHFLKNDIGAATALLTEFRERQPGFADASYWLGRCHYRRGEFDSAFQLFREACAATSGKPEYQHWAGRTSIWRLDFDTAIEFLLGAANLDATNRETWWWLARAYVAEGQLDGAALAAGQLWLRAGDSQRADTLLRNLRRFAPDHLEVNRQMARLQFGQGRFQAALPLLKTVANHRHAVPLDRSYLGWCYLTVSQFELAREQFEIVLSSPPDEFFAYEGYAWCLLAKGKPKESLRFFETLRSIPSVSPTRSRTGWVWSQSKIDPWDEHFRPSPIVSTHAAPTTPTPIGGKFTGLGVAGFWNRGLRVLHVVDGSPADAAGIQAADLITEIDGVSLTGEADLDEKLGPVPSHGRVLTVFWRGDQQLARFLDVKQDVKPNLSAIGILLFAF